MAIEKKHTYCALCISRCGCIATVEDGVLTRIEADPNHPTGQALCVKAKAAPEAVHAPGRLLFPQRRTQPKGSKDPGWQRIRWDEALDLLAEKIRTAQKQHGHTALALGVATPSGTAIADSFDWVHRLAHLLQSPNLVFATENCNWHKDFSPALTFGAGIGMPDYEHTRCILLWGFNPATSWLAQASAVQRARQSGAKLIVIDPRHAGLAASADLWLQPRPGTDAALAMGLAHQLIEANAQDSIFLSLWTNAPFLINTATGHLLKAADLDEGDNNDTCRFMVWNTETRQAQPCPLQPPNTITPGTWALEGQYTLLTPQGPIHCEPVFEALRRRCADWTPERVESVTQIPAEALLKAARLLIEHQPASFFTWTGTCQHDNATQTTRAINVLYALTGQLDAPGGNVWFDKPPLADVTAFDRVTPEVRKHSLGLKARPLGPSSKGWITTRDLFQTIVTRTPYPVSCFLSFGSNFLHSKPQTALSDEALSRLDFFALTELYETPTARHADLLLPVCTAWEREGLQAGFQVGAKAQAHIQLRPALVEPQGESRPDTWIIFELARRLGLADDFFGGEVESGLHAQLAPIGLSPVTLRQHPEGVSRPIEVRYRKYQTQGFATPSRRIELFSPSLQNQGIDPLPDFVPPSQWARTEGDETGAFDLLLTTAKWPQYCHSQHRDLPSLRRRMPEPLVEIHPDTAAKRGISANAWLDVRTRMGTMRARARLDAHLQPDVICAQYGWWQFTDGSGDANRILDGECFDPIAGSNNLRSTPCSVVAAKAQDQDAILMD